VLIIHAKDDERVDFGQGSAMAARLKGLGKPAVFVPIEKGGHSLVNEAAQLKMYQAVEPFLREHLGSGWGR
jgi:dipeptidyl aminopeptidase/acylaminoacyl peptidase